MKKATSILISMAFILACHLNVNAQRIKGNKNVIKKHYKTESFTGIELAGTYDVKLKKGDAFSVEIETDENLHPLIELKVKDDILHISNKDFRNPSKLIAYISMPELTYVNASGASSMEGQATFRAESFKLIASGASDVFLSLETTLIETELSGAADVELKGIAKEHIVEASGASSLNAENFITDYTDINCSGAASATVNAVKELRGDSEGAGSIEIVQEPEILKINRGSTEVYRHSGDISRHRDSTRVRVGRWDVNVVEDENTEVSMGSRHIIVDDDGNVSYYRDRKPKFNGHWGGLELGVSGYLNKDMEFDMPENYDFLDLTYQKSINVNLNIYEQNFNLINNKFGFLTGLGLQINNYRFDDHVLLVSDTSVVTFIDGRPFYPERNYIKSKLTMTYLTVPLIFEYQTNRFNMHDSFHLSAGMIVGARIGSHTKAVFKENGDKVKKKDRDDYNINPFKAEVTGRIGWGIINIYANYSLTSLFRDSKDPELYPFELGLSIVGW